MSPTKPKPRPSPAAGSAGDELVETLGLPAPSSTATSTRRRRQPAAPPAAAPAKSVRVTVDLGDGDYEQLRTWATNARVAGSDVVRAAIAHLAAHPPALDDVLGRAKAAKTERDRRRLGK
jgi:hypothetical protein